jgi:hypothetical protein
MQQVFNITQIVPTNFETQLYSSEDTGLISSFDIVETFNTTTDSVEYHIYDYNQQLIYSNPNSKYKVYNNNISIDPQSDITSVGILEGSYYTVYNFVSALLNSNADNRYYISEISSDRTEIRLDSNTIPNNNIIQGGQLLLSKINDSTYYYDFYLNFGENQLIIANNVAVDQTDPENPTILIKLYEPLPPQFTVYSELWVVENLREPVAYSIQITTVFEEQERGIRLKGPNFNINLENEVSIGSTPTSIQDLLTTNSTAGSGSLQYNLNSLLAEKGIELNIDYSDYGNFIHFSSAQTRLENFYYKLTLIEQYQASASAYTNTSTFTSASQGQLNSKIDEIITNFDGYEYYLYYTSASTAWPKTNTQPPYINTGTSTLLGTNWLNAQLISASNYDELNKDNLTFALPQYLRDDSNNSQAELFVQMLGQHFDILWTYISGITEKYDADNRLDYGISKDLVADALRDLGITIYQNNFSSQNLYSALLGITPSGSLLNIPNTTLTLPAGTGLEYITSFITASSTSSLVPLDDANKEIYKRIYHNLPYLLKKKGTVAGIRTLANIYGIPDTILRINEFGGKDRDNTNDWDNWQDQFNYSFKATGSNSPYFFANWGFLGSTSATSVPKTIEFRFKSQGIPSQSFYSQSVASFRVTSPASLPAGGLGLYYTGSGLTSGSYSGSTVDPYYQYGTLKWVSGSLSASIYLPFFNGEWWSVAVTADGTNHTLYAKQKGTYLGDNYIKYQGSSSYAATTELQPGRNNMNLVLPSSGSTQPTFGGVTHTPFQGNYQEVRYYRTALSQSVFDDFVLNPYSIEENAIALPAADLLFRAPLGTDLETYTTSSVIRSIHPSITGSRISQSFNNASSNYGLATGSFSTLFFDENQEFIYQDQPNAGIKIPISDKIKIGSQILPTGNTLSPYISIQQDLPISSSYTKDVNYVEVGFSPQDEINDDIQEQLGFFNYGDYIGDPRQASSSATSYSDLNNLRSYYFQKYYKNNNFFDYIRLVKYLDNSLFKMIKDFTPARAGIATGVIIKQHILERNRYRAPQVDWEDKQYTGSVGSLSTGYATGSKIYTFTGGTGGTLPTLTTITGSGLDSNISQSWTEVVQTPSGSATIIHNNLEEFYNGQFEGSTAIATTQNLVDEDCQQFLDVDTTEVQYKPILYLYNGSVPVNQSTFLSSGVVPSAGEILLYFISEQVEQGSPDSQQRPPFNPATQNQS